MVSRDELFFVPVVIENQNGCVRSRGYLSIFLARRIVFSEIFVSLPTQSYKSSGNATPKLQVFRECHAKVRNVALERNVASARARPRARFHVTVTSVSVAYALRESRVLKTF